MMAFLLSFWALFPVYFFSTYLFLAVLCNYEVTERKTFIENMRDMTKPSAIVAASICTGGLFTVIWLIAKYIKLPKDD